MCTIAILIDVVDGAPLVRAALAAIDPAAYASMNLEIERLLEAEP